MRFQMVCALSLALTACHLPSSTTRGPEVSAALGPGVTAQPVRPIAEAAVETSIKGSVTFPLGVRAQALPAEMVAHAVISLIDPDSNMTVALGKTDGSGNFTLALNAYPPEVGKAYLLEAFKSYGSDEAGQDAARLRTFLRWTGSAWESITQGGVAINALTTALALMNNLNPAVTAASLMGKVSAAGALVSAPAGYTAGEVNALAASIRDYLAGNIDPVSSVSALAPEVTGCTPPSAVPLSAIAVRGAGFSPVAGDNVVTFGGGVTGTVYMASPKELIVLVPQGATTGNLKVTTRSKDSNLVNFVVMGTGGAAGLQIARLSPSSTVTGDTITIVGAGFSPTPASNTVTFQKLGGGTVTATPTTADATSLSIQVPATATSGPVSVTVGGKTTNLFYFSVLTPIVSAFSPSSGTTATSVTVDGSGFGIQANQSAVKFNGAVDQGSIVSWAANQLVVKPPAPSLEARVSGPLVVSTLMGEMSQPFGNFTVSTSLVEAFAGAGGAGTTASWTGGVLQPNSAVTTFTQTNFSANSNTGNYVANASGLTINPVVSVFPLAVGTYQCDAGTSYSARTQLGVDGTYFFAPGTTAKTARRYSLSTGAFVDQTTLTYGDAVIWSPNNGYASIAANADRVFKLGTTWGGAGFTTPTAQSVSALAGSTHSMLATDGTTYYHYSCSENHKVCLLTSALATASPWPGSAYSCGAGPASAAGFTGVSEVLTNQGTATPSTALDRVNSSGWSKNAVALPFTLDGTGVTGSNVPLIGSNGTDLFILGRNAGYNANAISLFKFKYAGGVLTHSTSGGSAASTTAAIALPAGSAWNTVTFTRNVPANSTCTIDVLDGTTGTVLKSNIASGVSIGDLTASSLKLRASMSMTGTGTAPTVTNWSVTTRPIYAVSPAYDSGTNFATYQAPSLTSTGAAGTDYTITYSDSADGVTWGADVSNFTTLTRRYVRFKVTFKTMSTQLTRVTFPYQY
ncbi:IPT/TIG domain-containing protein [bacterium]|nr:IPT/TIG domain-containing protein [bacterium]